MSNILYISYDGMTDPLGQSQVLPYLSELANEHAITILSCEKPERFAADELLIRQICKDASIDWQPIFYTKRPPVLSTMKDIRKLHRHARELHRKKNFQITHCRSYISSLVGLSMKQTCGTKFIFDMRGFWADERIDGNLWRMSNPIHRRVYQFFKKRESQFLQHADVVVTLTQAAKDEMLTWDDPVEANKIQVIPCCADFHHFDYKRFSENCRGEVRSQLKTGATARVVGYLGSIGTWYMLEEMLQFFQQLQSQHPDTIFLFITNDSPELIREKAAKLGVDENLLRFTSGTRDEVPRLLAATDVNLFFIKPAFSKMSSSPTKLAEVMGMGLPVICNKGVGDINSIFSDGRLGCAIDVNAPQTWLEPIDEFEALLKTNKAMIRQSGLEQFNLESGIAIYRSIYKNLAT